MRALFRQAAQFLVKRRRYFYNEVASHGRAAFGERVDDLLRVVDLRESDTLLDVGCAEGLISLEVSKRVQSVTAFDISKPRIRRARELAKKNLRPNIQFSCDDVTDAKIEPMSFDVILFLGVFEKDDGSKVVGLDVVEKLLRGARRHFVMRFNIEVAEYLKPGTYRQMLDRFDQQGFEPHFFARVSDYGNLIVANRKPTDYNAGGRLPFHLVANY